MAEGKTGLAITLRTHPNDFAFPRGDPDDWGGLSIREYFAGLALQGIIANQTPGVRTDDFARFAVAQADALIDALNRRPQS